MNLNRTKVFINMGMLIYLALVFSTTPAYATDVPIFVDNVPAYSEVSPFYHNDTLLVPVRLVSEELGATVDWQNEQISISNADCDIVLYVGQNQAEINRIKQNLSAPPQVVQGRLFVPLRFIGENLGVRCLYRDEKIFLYSSDYDEKKFLYDGPDKLGPCMHKPNCIIYDNKTYLLENDTIKIRNNENDEGFYLPIYNNPRVILAISKSGLVYTNASAAYIKDKGTYYYNFSNCTITKLFATPIISTLDSNFDDNGYFYFSGASEGRFYQAIFRVDIDGTNIKNIFIEEPDYHINDIQSYNGWIYYVTDVPVVRDYGIDHYAGSLNRIRIDGTDKQQLTDEHIAKYYFTDEGIYYEYMYGRGSGLLKYEDLD